jgi:GT2 family glycosyltransferase
VYEGDSQATKRRVSILVPTLNATPLLFDCLRSIRSSVSAEIDSETIVIANGGRGAAAGRISAAAPWARVIATGANLGFGGGCNLGARSARGDFLVFLNDDAEAEPGWLEALVEAAERNPRAGAVGSLVLFRDGKVQEAGSIVWRDGSTLGIGRGLPLEECAPREVRQVDYCSACSLLVRRAAWEAAGGFDPRYYPAYYEDVDLCFTLRQLGWSVLFQPRSRVRHHETASSDPRKRLFLVLRNRKLFVEKWRRSLERHEPAEPESPRAVNRAMRVAQRAARHVLLIDDRPPSRAIGSGFALLFDAIRDLSGAGYSLSFAASDRSDGDLALLRDLGVEILDEPPQHALARTGRSYCTVVVSRPHNFERYGELVRRCQPHAALVYLAEALFHRRMERAAALLDDPNDRQTALAGALEMRELEERIVCEADHVVSVSLAESDWMARLDGGCPIEHILPTAPEIETTRQTFSERGGLLFVPGWLAGESSPNVDALLWFTREVLPLVSRKIPWIRLDVTGGDPPPSVRALARGSLRLLGRVDDLAVSYASARVVVVPVRIGSGVKIKTIEAIQYGVPAVTTEVGAEGLPADVADAISVADDPAKFAASVVELYTRADAWERRRRAAVALASRWRSQTRSSWSLAVRRARLRGPNAAAVARVV